MPSDTEYFANKKGPVMALFCCLQAKLVLPGL